MKVLMIAPPGAGKGTQGVVIASHFGIPHIATGDLLRDHVARGTELAGRSGPPGPRRLVPDDVVLDMVRERLEHLAAPATCSTACPARWSRPGRSTRSRVELDMTADEQYVGPAVRLLVQLRVLPPWRASA